MPNTQTKAIQLTPKQSQWLKDLGRGAIPARRYPPDSGGSRSVKTSLRRAGLLDHRGNLSDAGRVALANHVVMAHTDRRRGS